jgi:hypothetical protein
MRATYRALAHLIAGFVAIQAAVMVFAVAGLGLWIEDGHSVTESNFNENTQPDFTGSIGLALHGIFGIMVIPLLALLLLILSFFAKIPGGTKWAGFVLGAVVLQALLGIFGHEVAISGLLHGLNAFVLFSVALAAGRRVSTTADTATTAEVAAGR